MFGGVSYIYQLIKLLGVGPPAINGFFFLFSLAAFLLCPLLCLPGLSRRLMPNHPQKARNRQWCTRLNPYHRYNKAKSKASAEFIPSMVAGTISGYPKKKKKIQFLSSQQLRMRIRKRNEKVWSEKRKKECWGDELCVNVNAESLIIRLSLVKIVKCDVWWRSFFRIWTISRRPHTHTLLGRRVQHRKKKTYFAAAAGRH
jgi:hypothetical protein